MLIFDTNQKFIMKLNLSKLLFLSLIPVISLSCKNDDTTIREKVNASTLEVFKHNEMEVPSYNFDNFEKFLNIKDDEVYVVNFWATWCQPCVEELPYFESINTTYRHKGVNVLLVTLDSPKQVESRLFPFMEEHDIRSEVIMLNDPNANMWIPKVDPHWSGAIPITIIYNKKQRRFYERTFTLQELKTEVEKFL